MPTRPSTPCRTPGCPRLDCQIHSSHQRYDQQRPTAAERGYDQQWRKVRKVILAGEPLCRQCELEGRVTIATDVDHIVELSKGGEKCDPANLRPLCRACHRRRHAAEVRAFR